MGNLDRRILCGGIFGGFVAGLCGPDFIFEVSEAEEFAIGSNISNELLFARVEASLFLLIPGIGTASA
jgi:hypothetical protein